VVAFFQGGHGSFRVASFQGEAYLVASFLCLGGPYLEDASLGEDLAWAFLEEALVIRGKSSLKNVDRASLTNTDRTILYKQV